VPSAPSRWQAWALIAPALIIAALWWGLPLLQTVWLALADLGWALGDGGARLALRNTVVWIVVVAIGSTAAGLVLAWMAERLRAQRVLVPLVLIPTVVAPTVVAVAWRALLAFRPAGTGQVGLANRIAAVPGLDPVAWLAQAPLNTLLLAGALVWVQTGIAMLVLSVAIARVPGDVRDAARLDGATDLQVFGRITVPSITGAIIVAGLTSAAVTVKVFDLVTVATDGQHSTAVLGTESIHQAMRVGESGRGSALVVAMLVLVAPLGAWAVLRSRRALRSEAVS
jgi:alpha-glucoside transport system permease protein